MAKDVLGLDVGGVILDFVAYEGTDVAFSGDKYLETPAVKDSIESIALLNKGKFKDRIFLISRFKYGPERLIEWLRHERFFERTGIPESHFRGCAERKDKAAIAKKLSVTHFVDDRTEVLSYLASSVPHLYLFQCLDDDRKAYAFKIPQLRFFEDWKSLAAELEK